MTYLHYVIAAYAAFALLLLWDWLMPRWQIRDALRAARRRAARRQSAAPAADTLLSRD
jgi:heme exporter protein D